MGGLSSTVLEAPRQVAREREGAGDFFHKELRGFSSHNQAL